MLSTNGKSFDNRKDVSLKSRPCAVHFLARDHGASGTGAGAREDGAQIMLRANAEVAVTEEVHMHFPLN
jgi:hypothetical protein